MTKFLFFGPFEFKNLDWSNFSAPPLGVHRLASYLRNRGHYADVIDPDLEQLDEIKFREFVGKEKYDFIGISPTHVTLENDLGLAYLAKRYSPESIIIAGGPESTFAYDLVMDNSPVDIIVIGEGEKPTLELARAEKKEFEKIPGLILKNKERKIKTGPNKALNNEEFAEVTMAMDFNEIPYNRYWETTQKFYKSDLENPKLRARRMQEIHAMRFFQANYCPYNCTFCSSHRFQDNASGEKTKVVSLNEEQFIYLVKKAHNAYPQIQTVILQDDNFMVGLRNKKIERLVDVLEEERQQGGIPRDLSFIAQSRVDNVNLERLNLLKRANFRLISYGVESFSQRMLDEICKDTTVERAEKTLQETLAVGIRPYLNIILTAPNSTFYDMFETINRTVHYIEQGAEAGSYNTIIPLPGSKIEVTTRDSDLVEYKEARVAFTDYTFKKAERIFPKDERLREMLFRFDEIINERKAEFMDSHNMGHLPKITQSVSSKATRLNTLIRFATLYELAEAMNIQPYGGMAAREIPRIQGLLSKF